MSISRHDPIQFHHPPQGGFPALDEQPYGFFDIEQTADCSLPFLIKP